MSPSNSILGTFPREVKLYFHARTCTHMSTAALFITAKNWRQTQCPSNVNGQSVVCLYSDKLSNTKKERKNSIYYNMDEPHKHYIE